MSFAIDEMARRRPDFLDGVPVRLADGQQWVLPKPKARFAFAGDGYSVQLSCGPTITDEDRAYQAAYDAHNAATEADESTFRDIVSAQMRLAGALLRRNYQLSDDELSSLIVFAYDETDAAYFEIKETVLSIALGRGAPKASAGSNA